MKIKFERGMTIDEAADKFKDYMKKTFGEYCILDAAMNLYFMSLSNENGDRIVLREDMEVDIADRYIRRNERTEFMEMCRTEISRLLWEADYYLVKVSEYIDENYEEVKSRWGSLSCEDILKTIDTFLKDDSPLFVMVFYSKKDDSAEKVYCKNIGDELFILPADPTAAICPIKKNTFNKLFRIGMDWDKYDLSDESDAVFLVDDNWNVVTRAI